MPSVYDLKPGFQRLLRPCSHLLHRAHITPNQITIFTLLSSFAMGTWLYLQHTQQLPYLLLPVFLFIRMALNAIDGMIAKEFDLCTPSGAILNEVGDVLADSALYLPFCMLVGVRPELVILVAILAIVTELAGLASVSIGGQRRFDGPMGKSDRAFIFSVCGLYYGIRGGSMEELNYVLLAVVCLLVLTIFNRGRRALPKLERDCE